MGPFNGRVTPPIYRVTEKRNEKALDDKSRQGPGSIGSPSARISLAGLRPRRARLRFSGRSELTSETIKSRTGRGDWARDHQDCRVPRTWTPQRSHSGPRPRRNARGRRGLRNRAPVHDATCGADRRVTAAERARTAACGPGAEPSQVRRSRASCSMQMKRAPTFKRPKPVEHQAAAGGYEPEEIGQPPPGHDW